MSEESSSAGKPTRDRTARPDGGDGLDRGETCPACGEPMPPGDGAHRYNGDAACPSCLIRVALDASTDALEGTDGTLTDDWHGGPQRAAAPAEGSLLTGRYRLIERIGQGGMGVVYRAEQLAPVQREVAVKLIKRGMDTEQVLARFESERQALALMNHPAIARVFDGGATADGRPFFVMELVQGRPITKHCDAEKLDLEARIKLFCEVCEGVEHAHQKGILHRDLKPRNILADRESTFASPKIIDFGIAKAMRGTGHEPETVTKQGQWVGTPAYMSPEQRAGDRDIDTRSDVFSLGVVLYELLAGRRPYSHEQVTDTEPVKPSTAVSRDSDSKDAARRRGLDPAELTRALRGDLDWIVLKAMDPERERRYPSAHALANDLRRFLDDRPVTARPPSTAYRATKFLRRHWLPVAAITAVVGALAIGAVVATGQAIRASQAEDHARQEAANAQEVSDFLVGLFRDPDPSRAQGEELSARDLLARGVERLELAPPEDAQVQANLLSTIGDTYVALGDLDDAESLFTRAESALRAEAAVDPLALARVLHLRGERALLAGDFEVARSAHEEALALRTTAGADDGGIADSHNALGSLALRLGASETAAEHFEQGLELRRRQLGDDHLDVAKAANNLGIVYYMTGRYDEARRRIEESLAAKERQIEGDHPTLSAAMTNLGLIASRQGKLEDALAFHQRALAMDERLVGPDHRNIAGGVHNVAIVLKALGRFEEARGYYERSLAIREREDPEGFNIVEVLSNFGMLLTELGEFEQAEEMHRRSMRIRRHHVGEDHPNNGRDLHGLGELYFAQDRYEEAEQYLTRALDFYTETLGRTHDFTAAVLRDLSRLFQATGRQAEADAAWEESDRIYQELGIEAALTEERR